MTENAWGHNRTWLKEYISNAHKCLVNAQSPKRSSILSSIFSSSREILRAFKTFRTLVVIVLFRPLLRIWWMNLSNWASGNPRVIVKKLLHSTYITVWCAFCYGEVIGPYFFENEAGNAVRLGQLGAQGCDYFLDPLE